MKNTEKIPMSNKSENCHISEDKNTINQNKDKYQENINQYNIKDNSLDNGKDQEPKKPKGFIINKDIDNISDNSEEIPETEKVAKRVINNNKFIYSKEKNIFFVDDNEDSDKEKNNSKISRKNKNNVNKIYKNKEIEGKNSEKDDKEENLLSNSENEEIENSEIETVSDNEQEEEEIEIEEKEGEDSNNNKLKEDKKDIFLLELNDIGLPNIQNDEILSCNINSIINISIYNGLPISKDICLLTNSVIDFPSPFYLDEIIEEINSNSKKILNRASPHNIKKQKYIIEENNNILKSLKKYKIYPYKINTKIYFKISCKRSGNIYFIFMYKDQENNKTKFTKPFNILVNPLIDLNNKNNLLDINQIQMQSIIPKNIGCLSGDFEKYYEEASLLEYNFIHFHSFEELSGSNNIYIIKNQNELNNDLFINENIDNLDIKQKYQLLNNSIKNLKNKYHIGAITDIILSHTSSESEWIYENNDFTYNLKNTPWLTVSYELDKILMNYSKLFSARKVSCKSAPYIYNINDINQIISEITSYIEKSNLYEFFMIPEEHYVNKFQNYYRNLKNEDFRKNYLTKKNVLLKEITKMFVGDREDKINEILTNINYMINLILKSCINYGFERYGVKICVEYVAILVIESYKEENKIKNLPSENDFIKEIKSYLNIINNKWMKEIKELLKTTVYNLKEYLRYKYLQLNNKRKITQLIDSYFIVKNENNPSEIYLSNGWIMNLEDPTNPFPDTVKYGTWYYLKRKVIIFKETIKINYGTNINNVPSSLLDFMSKYISNLASIFDGLYIDSIGYIPIYVLKYLIYIARKINPSIIFLSNVTRDNINNGNHNSCGDYLSLLKKTYVEELGINLFINELIWDNNETEIINSIINKGSNTNSNIYPEIITHFSDNLYSSSFIDENKIYFGKFKFLKAKQPLNIIYDTYSGRTFFEKFKKLSLNLPILSLAGLIDNSVGSTYGFDNLYPLLLPNKENDHRKYDINNTELKKLIEKTNNTFKINAEETYEVFFEYHPDGNKNLGNICGNIYSVDLALNIFNYKPNIKLTRIKKNLYMVKTRLPPGKYYYQFVINENIWVYDNTQPMEEDENGILYNVIDLRSQNKMIIPDIKLFRKEINNVRNYFKNKKSEIYVQKNKDMIGVVRVVTETKSLINNNLDENKVLKIKNKMTYLAEQDDNDNDSDYENDDEINNRLYKSPDIKKGKYNILAKSFDQVKKIDESLLFYPQEYLQNSINVNLSRHELKIDSYNNKNQNKKEIKDKILQKENLSNNYTNIQKSKEPNNNNVNEIYNGFAIITFPSFDKNSKVGKGEIIIPGKISELICACYFNGEKTNFSRNLNNSKIKFPRNEIYFTKDINYLKCISNIKYNQDLHQTIIEFYNAPQNISIIIKFINETKNVINNLDENLEILFNKGYEFINYFDILEINKLLFRTEKEEKNNTNNKRGTYEMKISLFKDISNNNNVNYITDKNLRIKSIYAGINELVELIKTIKKNENQHLFYSTQNEFNSDINEKIFNSNIMFNSLESKKIKTQSLYKDIYTSDNYINYIMGRLSELKSFKLLYNFMKKLILPEYKLLPSFIKPIYFEKIIISLYQNIIRVSLGKIPSYILNFGDFGIGLSLSIYEFIKKHISCSFNNRLIKKYDIKNKQNKYTNIAGLSVCNGLPINERNNNINIRDILIGFKSLFLIPKLYYEGKIILKLIGSTMKYGLIPEKIDNSNNFNYKYYSRDICWFYIKAIKDYIHITLDYNFLKEEIYLINLPENVNSTYLRRQKTEKNKKIFTVENIIQLIFQYHAQGINFIDKEKEVKPVQKPLRTKKNSNNSTDTDIDSSKINICLDLETGFIYGGNKLNAGTWMNHIGTSKKAKNINIPATPRDGADIEIIALLFSCLNFVIELNYKNCYSYKNVILNTNEILSFYQWSLLIKKYFEKKFFIDKTYPSIQNKPYIYKDYITKSKSTSKSYNEIDENNNNNIIFTEEEKNELKFRPNVLLAIYYAPDLFSYENVVKILENVDKYLLRPEIQNQNKSINDIGLGMNGLKTLDKTDLDYNGKLDFKESNYFKTSCGFNIHNGVEFVWLYGIYLMIKIKYMFNFNYDFVENNSKDSFIPEKTVEMVRYASKKLIGYIKYVRENRYMGIPEIIDEIGNVSNKGNQSDLKSMAILLELINKLAWASDKVYNDANNDDDGDISSKDDDFE